MVEEANGKDGFRVLMVGDASAAHDNYELSETDLRRGERIGIPVAMIILVVLFGTLVAALAPIGLSIVCIIIALGMAALIGQVFELIFFVTLMIIMIGLAVGIDYSLIIISRYRDELARGLDKNAAIERSGATAGRTALFSGLHRSNSPLRPLHCSLLLLPVPCHWSHIGGTGYTGGHPHPAAGHPCAPWPQNQPSSHPFLWQGKERPLRVLRAWVLEVMTRVVTKAPIISIIAVGAPW